MNEYPNFFIVGSPKSGTTSLYKYLSEHPNVFMSPKKGPHYFASDLKHHNRVKNKKDYLNLFKDKTKKHFAVGEASVLYLCSKKAIKKIAKTIPNTKIIIILRNPVEALQSWHAEMVWSRLENNENLEKAWSSSISISNKGKNYNVKLDYKNIFKYGEQVSKVFKYFKKENVMIIHYEDYTNSTKKTFKDINNFLNIPHYELKTYDRYNTYKKYKYKFLQDFLTHPPVIMLQLLKYFKVTFGIKKIGVFKKILKLNTFNPKKPDISDSLKQAIRKNYNDDINELSKILETDFNILWFG